jgi:hypothetical protein
MSDRELSDLEAKRLADYAANRLGAEERKAFEREILASPAIAGALYEDLGTQAMLDEAKRDLPAATTAPANVSRRASARWWRPRWALPIAAMLLVALLTPRLLREIRGGANRDESGEFRFRSPGVAGDTRPRAIAPIGEIESLPARFVWSRDAGATAYRLELRSDDDRFAYSRVTSDTTLVIDQKVFPWNDVAGATWSVVPLAGNQERAPSDPTPIRIKRR